MPTEHTDLVVMFNVHQEGGSHELSLESAGSRPADPLRVAFTAETELQQRVMAGLFKLAAFIAKQKPCFFYGVDMGGIGHSRKTAQEMSRELRTWRVQAPCLINN